MLIQQRCPAHGSLVTGAWGGAGLSAMRVGKAPLTEERSAPAQASPDASGGASRRPGKGRR